MASRTPEGKVKERIRKILEREKVYYKCPLTGGYGDSGQFDIYGVFRGYAFGIEVKATCKAKPTALQSSNAKEFLAAGGVILLLHGENLDELETALSEMKNGNPVRSVWTF